LAEATGWVNEFRGYGYNFGPFIDLTSSASTGGPRRSLWSQLTRSISSRGARCRGTRGRSPRSSTGLSPRGRRARSRGPASVNYRYLPTSPGDCCFRHPRTAAGSRSPGKQDCHWQEIRKQPPGSLRSARGAASGTASVPCRLPQTHQKLANGKMPFGRPRARPLPPRMVARRAETWLQTRELRAFGAPAAAGQHQPFRDPRRCPGEPYVKLPKTSYRRDNPDISGCRRCNNNLPAVLL